MIVGARGRPGQSSTATRGIVGSQSDPGELERAPAYIPVGRAVANSVGRFFSEGRYPTPVRIPPFNMHMDYPERFTDGPI